ncbi:MFS general substrate transporter [Dichomitus squalens LYAD-421 SS1]|uniref:MFS general substrate transporter n=2 Tax=Dichomitus squalens TaxID=114155 RepID=A0A4Q9MLC4_9APHY|nr:MFS general substrate transporter [Dichomitus squalens LYAD-421 SS1]EJF56374.1 MFS general substrate transporter [Dichomitus squalens LYAD-421 SS1]TBU27608.1 MFS general substrate transporter [Dichomitus squalens]
MVGSLEKAPSPAYDAGSLHDKERDPEKVLETPTSESDSEANVGLHEFDVAKQTGLRVTPEESRRVARKIDIWILPMLCVCQGLSILDKSALNYGNLYGMKRALHLTGDQYSWFASVFYIGYLVGNYPDGWLLQHYPSGKVLAITTFIWGTIVLTTAACTNFAGTMANRFFLGLLEAIVTPGMTILTAIWYTQNEVPFRSLIWYSFNGWSGIFGGFVAYGIGHISHPAIDLWKYVFLILGAISVSYSFVLWFLFPDSPVEARFLTEEEKIIAVKRVAEGKMGVKNKKFKWYQVQEALIDPKTWLLFVASIAAQIPNGVISNFSTIIIKGMGFTTLQSTLLDAASSGVQIFGLLSAGFICMRFKNMRVITMAAGNITCIIAAACLTYLPSHQQWNRLVAFWFTQFQSVGFSLSLVMISNNVGGFTKRTFVTAVTFVGYCVGNVIGPHFILDSEAPRYTTGTKAMFIGYVIKTVAHLALGLYMLWSNIRRDREQGKVTSPGDQLKGEEAGMHDLTEWENKFHRYVL